MDFKEKEMNLELKEQDSEHNKKKKEEGSPKRKKAALNVFKVCLFLSLSSVSVSLQEDKVL